jgi:hypothetical protein
MAHPVAALQDETGQANGLKNGQCGQSYSFIDSHPRLTWPLARPGGGGMMQLFV